MRLRVACFSLTAALAGLLMIPGCSVKYLAIQGYYQAELLMGREDISDVLQEPDLAALSRQRLELVLEARDFGEKVIGLTPTTNYTTINRDWNRTIYNVSACRPLAFEPYTWWFPVVGRVPYKGFFRKEDGEAQRDKLLAEGWEVAFQRVGGFSTLGYFSDPVLPHMLLYPELDLINLILHELAHGTLYFKGQADFNESFATFVGDRGLLYYLDTRYGPESTQRRDAEAQLADEALDQRFMWRLYQELDQLYKSDVPDGQKLTRKGEILKDAAVRYHQEPWQTERYRGRDLPELGNAHLLAFARYNSAGTDFDVLLGRLGGSWPRFISAIRSLETSDDPFRDLKESPQLYQNF